MVTKQIDQSLWGKAEALLTGKFIPLSTCIRQKEKYQSSNLSCHLNKLEKRRAKETLSEGQEGNMKDKYNHPCNGK